MKRPVEDIMLEIQEYVAGEGSEYYDTVVIDTGDELQKALKEGKKHRNRGKWAISDWGWLADEYHKIVNGFIDLPKHIIVAYHLKNTQEGEDGSIFKEIALQGAAKDDTPGWFDIVGVLDTYEQVDEKGNRTSHRGLLTSPTARYGWVKDHSGQLPPVFDVSEDFVGDFDRIHSLIYGPTSGKATKVEHELLTVVKTRDEEPSKPKDQVGIPTPQEVDAKKGVDPAGTSPIAEEKPVESGGGDPADMVSDEDAEVELETQLGATEVIEEVEEETVPESSPEPVMDQDSLDLSADEPESEDEDESDAEEVDDPYKGVRCEVCNEVPVTPKYDENGDPVLQNGEPVMVVDDTLIDLGKVKFRKVLCQTHLLEMRKK
jgi:hypothetical protein